MNRLMVVLRWRRSRWFVCGAIVPLLWACDARKLVAPTGGPSQVLTRRVPQSVNRDLDLLFVVDDSSSMLPLQTKMAQRLPDFMNVLKGLTSGLPNLHVAVISTSLGAGAFANVPGCLPGSVGNTGGKFQHRAECTMLHSGQTFIRSIADPAAAGGRRNNFDGDIADVFSCIAQIDQRGCGFEHQFENTRLALQKALNINDPDNGGFLRPGALLAVVMVTNEDDCSVNENSMLFDPAVQKLSDVSSQPGLLNGVRLGALHSYRCNKFGHRCGGMELPHDPPAATTPLSDCTSAEDGVLVKVSDFVAFLKSVKSTPEQVLVAAIAGPATPYAIVPSPPDPMFGITETIPTVGRSCTQPAASGGLPEFADPAVRIKQWLDAFPNSVFDSICANDFAPAMTNIAAVIGKIIEDPCIDGDIALRRDLTTPDCDVVERTYTESNSLQPTDSVVPFCPVGRAGTDADKPCWQFAQSPRCPNGQLLQVCYDVGCSVAAKPTGTTDALITCAVNR